MRLPTLLLFVLVVCSVAVSQEFSIARVPDTLSLRDLAFPKSGNTFVQPSILVPLDFSDSLIVNNLPPGFFRMSMMMQPSFTTETGPLSSLQHQTYRSDWWKYVYTALGAVQVGADAYFTYRALKKYGYIR